MMKDEIRKSIKQKKRELAQKDIINKSNIIIDKLLAHPSYQSAKVVLTYVSFNQEVKTHELINKILEDSKIVAVPKVDGKDMKFFYIKSMEDLSHGVMGILEPTTGIECNPTFMVFHDGTDLVEANNGDILVVVPGLAFDKNKNRIGYGKGYYDNFFLKHSAIPMYKIALAYEFQVLDELKVNEYDVKVDEILTEEQVYQ